MKSENSDYRFLDEAGDTTFFGKGKIPIIGQNGVSNTFIIGMLKIKEDISKVRENVRMLQKNISENKFLHVPSVLKKIQSNGFYFHATDDIPEIRMIFLDFIRKIDCSFEAVVARKIPSIFLNKHNNKEDEFYADLLSHLIKNKLNADRKIILIIAERGKTTRNQVLDNSLKKAKERYFNNNSNSNRELSDVVVFNIQNQITEPLLNIVDYFCWSIQRVFERGEVRYYDYLKDRISLVVDLYDKDNYEKNKNYYRRNNPLTEKNKISPPLY